jgi:hypothetical protein
MRKVAVFRVEVEGVGAGVLVVVGEAVEGRVVVVEEEVVVGLVGEVVSLLSGLDGMWLMVM